MPTMSETIDTSLDRLANGVDDNQRLVLESILRTGLHYMSDEQIHRTRTLCSAALFHRDTPPAYQAGMRQMHPGRDGRGHGSDDSRSNGPAVPPAVGPRPGDKGYDS
ncbi:MAG TPA: hypothetical protein PKV72_02270 [Candidatus Peribacteria bacterium]|nr:hypothetical protein [Candidatus Peribacteria bacterium]